MKRRDMIKVGAATVALAAVNAFASSNDKDKEYEYEEFNPYKPYREGIVNREKYSLSEKPTDYELKHTPEIKVGKKDDKGFSLVEITVGQNGIIHPTSKSHWIDFIELKADGELIERVIFEPGKSLGYAAFKVNIDNVKSLTAVEGCNLHGIWEYTIRL